MGVQLIRAPCPIPMKLFSPCYEALLLYGFTHFLGEL